MKEAVLWLLDVTAKIAITMCVVRTLKTGADDYPASALFSKRAFSFPCVHDTIDASGHGESSADGTGSVTVTGTGSKNSYISPTSCLAACPRITTRAFVPTSSAFGDRDGGGGGRLLIVTTQSPVLVSKGSRKPLCRAHISRQQAEVRVTTCTDLKFY